MSQYRELDKRIVIAIRAQQNPLYAAIVSQEASRLANESGREAFRVIDGRLQALRKAGRICHLTKADGQCKGGWQIVEQ